MINKKGSLTLVLLPLFFILIFFYIPLLNILVRGINISFFKDILDSFYYYKIISFTIFQSILSALLSVLIALPGAYLVSRHSFPGKKLFLSLCSLPFILPSILTVLGFVLLFGNSGYINNFLQFIFKLEEPPLRILYSLKAVLLAHIFYNFPLAIRIISNRWSNIPYEVIEASYSLGKGKIETFFRVTLPYLLSSILTSFTLIFLYCFMSFGIILVLGGGPSLSTIEVEVYRFARISLDINKAATLSIIESIFTLTALFLYLKSEKGEGNFTSGFNKTKKLSVKKGLLFSVYLIPIFLILVAPIISIIISSFIRKIGFSGNSTFTLYWYKTIFSGANNKFYLTAINSIKNSLLLGFSTIFVVTPFALLISYNSKKLKYFKSLYNLVFFIPMGISSIIIGLGYLTMDIPRSYILIVFAHTFISLPLAIRSINNTYRNIDNSLIEASQSLGVTRFKTFLRVEFPLLRGGLITAAVFSFSLSIGEMNAAIMLAPNGYTTIPLAIYQLIGSYNYYGACALGTILFIVCLISFRLMDEMDL